MAKKKNLSTYDERYRQVFSAGALHWNSPRPNPHLARVLERIPPRSRCIEFGCGEGYQARLVASKGHSVTAIDISPAAIAKAVQLKGPGEDVDFICGDITEAGSIRLNNGSYDLAVDIGCLHMIVEDEDRSSYLQFVHAILKNGGLLFLQDGLDLDDVAPQSEEEGSQLREAKRAAAEAKRAQETGSPLPRMISTPEGERQIMLPLCPARMRTLDAYIRELELHGLKLLSCARVTGSNTPFEALVVAENQWP